MEYHREDQQETLFDEPYYGANDCLRDCMGHRTIYEEKPYPDCKSVCGIENETLAY